ncbi:MAG: glycosyltransferase family 2 protein [Actinobacteria bacterium]|nr:glycosyltransferase family 2 protein [Actinomycetota bacterium]
MDLDPSAEPELAAPPAVVAVMVTHDPGEWFDSALAALGAQDYENLSVLVIDAASDVDPTSRVAAVAPEAFVRRLATDPGWARAANEALDMVQGASYLLFCHDDAALAPDAVRLLVEESYRSNAGVIGPKLVDWDDHFRITSAGLTIDKTGVVAPLVDSGELDQEQHDAVRDVFAVDGAVMLVRADLAITLGGFEPKLWPHGEDIDFCWRAQIAGARVLAAPAARASHRGATVGGYRSGVGGDDRDKRDISRHRDDVRAAEVRHRIRMVFTNYTPTHLVRIVPQLIIVQLGELVYALLAGRRRVAASIVGGWYDVLRDIRGVRESRKRVNATRLFPDSEIRRLQTRGFARINRFIRGQLHGEDRARAFAESGAGLLKEIAGSRSALIAWGAVAFVLLAGTRGLLSGDLPAVGQFAPPPAVGSLFRQFFSGWRFTGLGAESPAPPAFALLGIAGTILFGAVGAAQKVLILGLVPLGLFGAFRLARSVEVPRAGLVGLAAYAVVPLPYASLARGRWDGLIAYAVAPWLLARMRAGAEGMGERAAEPADGRHRAPFLFEWRSGLGVALMLGVAAAFAPGVLAMTLLLALGVLVGSLLVRAPGDGRRALSVAGFGIGVALLLLAPWSFTMLHPEGLSHALFGPGLSPSRALPFGAALRLETGRLGGAPFGWALLVAAALPLLIGRGWRLSWAIRCWAVIVVNAAFLTVVGRGWVGLPVPSAELFLAPVAIAIAWSIALGFISFRIDLREFRFGAPQVAAAIASVAFFAAAIPVVAAAGNGRWGLEPATLATQLGYIEANTKTGDFRVLWLGDPETLPVDGWRVAPGLAYGTSRNGLGELTESWAPTRPGPSMALGGAVRIALNGRTTRLGHLLGPMGVRYVVVPKRVGPEASGRPALAPSRDVAGAMAEQADFRQLDATEDLAVFENASWVPIRAALDATHARGVASAGTAFVAATDNVIGGAAPALTTRNSDYNFAGSLRSDALFFAESPTSRWKLTVGNASVSRRTAYGVGTLYTSTQSGPATLNYHTSPIRWLSLLFELAVWALVIRAAWAWRRSTRGELT